MSGSRARARYWRTRSPDPGEDPPRRSPGRRDNPGIPSFSLLANNNLNKVLSGQLAAVINSIDFNVALQPQASFLGTTSATPTFTVCLLENYYVPGGMRG